MYTGGASLLWDNHYVGEMMANWTRGVARATIRAAGPVGKHTIQIGNAISYLYLNVPAVADSLYQWRHGHLHRDKGRRPAAFVDRLARRGGARQ